MRKFFPQSRLLIFLERLNYALLRACVKHHVLSREPNSSTPDNADLLSNGSGVYHCPGTSWYGNTKQGEYIEVKVRAVLANEPVRGGEPQIAVAGLQNIVDGVMRAARCGC